MKILLSAYGCSPRRGSEPGVGWRWAEALAGKFDVTLITHPFFRDAIAAELAQRPLPNLTVVYYEPAGFGIRRKPGSLNSRLYCLAWQAGILFLARRLARREQFDLAHHITWGTFRFPSFLGFLGLPFVFGPVGGGERAPLRLFKGMPLGDRIKEVIRGIVIASARYDPLLRSCLMRASIIFCKTEETRAALPRHCKSRAIVAQEIGAPDADHALTPAASAAGTIRLLYAGRLIGWKGVSFAIRAAGAAMRRGVDVWLDIVGAGSGRAYLEQLAGQERLGERVKFLGQVERDVLMQRYANADAFIFPSLHDSSGNVVLESMSRGLPVLCLDLGGPSQFVDDTCGAVVSTRGADVGEVVDRLASIVERWGWAPEERLKLRDGALARASELTWRRQVDFAYAKVLQKLRQEARPSPLDGAFLDDGRPDIHA